jgi:gamma-glutamyltranspeptidase/glutathione hydrolase
MPTPQELRYASWIHRPPAMATRAMVASGHPLASLAAMRILDRGGNAIDAGVAAGLCLTVLQSDFVNFAGVAPIMIYPAEARKVITISGLGPWPRKASIDFFRRHAGGDIPPGVLRTVVPGSPDAWITALERYGTLRFAEVAEAAIDLAENGFPMHRFMSAIIKEHAEDYRRFPTSAAIYLPDGRPPEPGERFFQKDLARTIRIMVDQEDRCRFAGRSSALRAARDAFYKGEIARTIARFYQEQGGLLTYEDLAEFQVRIEPPVVTAYQGYAVYACGPWCQGPVVPQALNLLEPFDPASLEPNGPEHLHLVVEALKLAFADRHAFYGDPAFVEVPLEGLLSKAYARDRGRLIDPRRAAPEMPPAGDPWAFQGRRGRAPATTLTAAPRPASAFPDTTYLCVVDRHGNAFSATPSDASFHGPVVPGTGVAISSRGIQAWLDPDHPSSVQPGKRPRLTPNPGLVLRDGELAMAYGTPGGDVQCQAMLQVFLNILDFDMNPQEAVEAPRVATYSFPASHHPHPYTPRKLYAESRLDPATWRELEARGHEMVDWSAWNWKAGAVCAIVVDEANGILVGGADPRREAYAIGW